jgi:Ca2+-binding RTX toxin-like protein
MNLLHPKGRIGSFANQTAGAKISLLSSSSAPAIEKGVSLMRRTLLLMATTALALLVTSGVALAASINCPTAPGGYCYGTGAGDALYGTSNVDRIYGYGGTDLMYGYGSGDFMYGGAQGDRMLGGGGADRMNGQGGADAIYGGAGNDTINGGAGNDIIQGDSGSDTLNTGTGSDRVNARDGERDFITCDGANDLVYYDVGLDVLQGCGSGLVELPPPDGLFEEGTKVLVEHKGNQKELCVAEAALKGHLNHGDEIINAKGCSA